MTPTAFTNLKPGDKVEILRGRLRGVPAVVTGHVGDGCHVRITLLTNNSGIFARATTIKAVKA